MDDIEKRLLIVVQEAAGVYAQHMPLSRLALQKLRGYVVARRAVLYGGVVYAFNEVHSEMLSIPLVISLLLLAASVGTKSRKYRSLLRQM